MVYSVSEYLEMMVAADRAPGTIRGYQYIFQSFARFLDVPVDEIHNYLSPENLIKYAGSLSPRYAGVTARQRLAILRAYYEENGIEFKGLQAKVLNARRRSDPEDKPLTLDTLQKMMDLADERGKAFITFMVSTGMRPGEAAQLTLSDVKGDTVTIPGSIAKNKRGGKVYLTSEAREYLDIWLRNRAAFIKRADAHTKVLIRKGRKLTRPEHDDRLFASGYTGLNSMFKRLYGKVDGERGRYRRKITPHSMRKYFRTNAVKTMDLDLVEKLMRHSGYLTGSYVRITPEEARKQFHAGEAALYITRRDQRKTETEIAVLKQQNESVAEMDRRMAAMEKIIARMGDDRRNS